jgi:hypothetical protein
MPVAAFHLEFDWHVQFRGALYRFLAARVWLIRYDGRGNGLSDREPRAAAPRAGLARVHRGDRGIPRSELTRED